LYAPCKVLNSTTLYIWNLIKHIHGPIYFFSERKPYATTFFWMLFTLYHRFVFLNCFRIRIDCRYNVFKLFLAWNQKLLITYCNFQSGFDAYMDKTKVQWLQERYISFTIISIVSTLILGTCWVNGLKLKVKHRIWFLVELQFGSAIAAIATTHRWWKQTSVGGYSYTLNCLSISIWSLF
jgi:hypothetical protein